jgi:hypothetical protein
MSQPALSPFAKKNITPSLPDLTTTKMKERFINTFNNRFPAVTVTVRDSCFTTIVNAFENQTKK